jgi:vacuolar protein sorting-associated protein 45
MLSKSKKIFSSIFTEIHNVYMQHKPYVSGIVDSAFKCKLSAVDFPSPSKEINLLSKPTNLIAFIVGGATFEEATDLSTCYNQERDTVILGGSCVQNSKSFIADLMSIQQLVQPAMHSFEIENPKHN